MCLCYRQKRLLTRDHITLLMEVISFLGQKIVTINLTQGRKVAFHKPILALNEVMRDEEGYNDGDIYDHISNDNDNGGKGLIHPLYATDTHYRKCD